ncbi:YdcF family protein, partial [Neisseria sp. P0022.S010]
MISLLKSRNGLRYYLFRGLALSVLLVCGIFLSGTWQIYRTGLQTLPKDVHA